MPGNIGWQGAIIILVVLLVVFGPKRLPEMGRSLGRGMREFKDSVTGKDDDDEPRELPPAADDEPVPAPPAARARLSLLDHGDGCRGASLTVRKRRSSSTSRSCARG